MDVMDELAANREVIQRAFNVSQPLLFRKLKGGICNAPIQVYYLQNEAEISVGVLKVEPDDEDFTRRRFTMLDEMTANGFQHNPKIIKNAQGDYLTRIGSRNYSLIEYIEADNGHYENNVGFAEMLQFTALFHKHSHMAGVREDLEVKRYDLHFARQSIIDKLPEFTIGADFFASKAWRRVENVYRYFATATAKKLFDTLPRQIIIGDNHQHNLLFRNNQPIFIDLDARRYDLRLYDLVAIIAHGSDKIRERYLMLAESGILFSEINKHYELNSTPLTEDEIRNFNLILIFTYIEFLSWALNRLFQYQTDKQHEEGEQLLLLIVNKVSELTNYLNLKLVDEVRMTAACDDSPGFSFLTKRTPMPANPIEEKASNSFSL